MKKLGLIVLLGIFVQVSQGQTLNPTNATSFCNSGSISVTGYSGSPTFTWYLNGAVTPGNAASLIVTSSGNYSVSLNGGTPIDTVTITINPQPAVSISVTNNNSCSGSNVQFIANITSGTAPFTFSWDFGDATSSSSSNPTHAYTALGCGSQNFNVSLTITDSKGCSASANTTVTVKQIPDIALEDPNIFSPFRNCDNSPTTSNPNYTLTVNNISVNNSCVSSYTLNWGDGSPILTGLSMASFPLTHTYTQVGAFPLTLTGVSATNPGCVATKTYTVANQSNPAGGLGTLGNTTGLCAPATVPFIINNWQSNSAGTTYVLDFGDGTSVTLNHPLNGTNTDETINHTYTTSSCPQSAYTATLTVRNACDNTPYTAGNIQIRIKPTAQFDMPLTGCVGQSICFANTSILGGYGPSCSTVTAYSWNFGDPASGAANTSTSTSPCHTYTTPGTYTISLEASNPCGPSTVTKQICIAAVPVPSFTLNNNQGCFPLLVTATDNTPTANSCNVLTRSWSVAYTPGFCGSASDWTFAGGTNNTSVSPQFNFQGAGVYTITLAVTNPCGTFTTSQTVTVKGKPTVTLSGITNGCAPVSISPTATVTNCGSNTLTYTWAFPGGTPSSSGLANPGTISFPTNGTFPISLGVANECGTTTANQNLIVQTPPVATAGTNQTICGTTATMAANTPSPGTGQWAQVSGPPGANISNPLSPGTIITNLAPGTYVFSWTVTNSGCSNTSNVTVTVSPGPSAANAGTDIALCNVSSITLAGNNPSIGTGQWAQVSGTPASISNPGQYNTTVTGLTPGVYIFSWTINNSVCPATSDNVQVTISATPTTANAGPNQTLCGTSTSMAANTPVVGTGSWTQLSGAPANINTPGSPTTTISGLLPGNYSFQWTISNGACTSSSPVTISISSGPSASLAGPDQSLCQATSTTLAANNPGTGTGAWTQVSGPAGAIFTDNTQNNTAVTNLQPGVYIFRWTISYLNCTPNTDEIQVTIYDNPTVANAGNDQTICSSVVTLTGNNATIGTGAWTQVSGPPGASINNPVLANTTVSSLITGTYVFRWTISNGICAASQDDVSITVTATPTIANAGPDQSLCNVNAITLAGNTASTGTGTWSLISGPPGASISSPNQANSQVTGLTFGTYILKWEIANGVCPSTQDNVQINIYEPATVADAGPNQIICGTTASMAANTAIIGTGFWTQTSGVPATITTPSSPNTSITGLTVGNYTFQWTITNGACSSNSSVNITISSGPTTSNAGPDQELCLATSTTLSANTPSVGTGVWSQVSGNTVTMADPNQASTGISGLTPGVYVFQWTISFSNCTPSTDQVTVTIYDNPTVADAGPDQNICIPSASVLGNIPTIGSGIWSQVSGPNNAFIVAPANNSTAITGMSTGTYVLEWTISNGVCPPSSDQLSIVYSVLSNNTISGAIQTCINTAPGTITGSTPAGSVGPYQYQWQVSTDNGNTWIDLTGENNIDYTPPSLAVATCYRRMVTTSLCSGTQANPSNVVCIEIKPDAHAEFTASQLLLCAPVNLDTIITVTHLPLQNAQYNWYQNGTLIPATTNGLPPSFIITNPGQTVTIKLVTISPYGCLPDSMELTFNTRPAVVANFIKDTTAGCGPLSVNFTNTSSILNGSIEYYWDFGNGQTLSNIEQPGAPVIFNPSPEFRDTTYFILLKAYNGCDTVMKMDSIKVYAQPKARFFAQGIGCSPFRDTVINSSFGQDAFTTYYWDFGDGTRDTTYTLSSIPHQYITGITDTFRITLIMVNRCASDTATMDVIVSPSYIQEHIAINGSQIYGCAPHTVDFQNSSTGATVIYVDFGDGSPIEAVPNTQSVISHTYLTGGNFTAHFTLENYCADTSADKQITVYDPPQASFTLTPNLICTGQSVTTNNNSMNGNSYEWYWGDNTSTAGLNATHFYNLAGVYTVKLVARKVNSFGTVCTDTATALVTVVDIVPAEIIVDPTTPACAPYNMQVSAQNAALTSSVNWVFYDSQQAPGVFYVSGPTASHIFTTPGIDSVKLITTNLAGCKDSSIYSFTVNSTPQAVFEPFEIKTCNTDTIAQFSVDVNYPGPGSLQYEWYVNDVLMGNSNPFSYHFQVASGVTAIHVFSIKVLVKNNAGCGDTAHLGNFIIQTLGPRNIVVSPSMVQYQPNYSFTFTDSASALPNATWLWNPGDRNQQTLPGNTITYSYGDTGTYHVNLLVQDYETGCFATDTISVYVLPVPGYLYVPNAFCPGCHKAELRQFLPLGKGLKDYHLVIYNIWGQKVFETRSLDGNGVPNEGWNGNWKNGQNTKQEAYSWFIEAHYINGTEWKGMLNPKNGKLEKKGFITIIR
ncbi:MAG: PKD domain-containing protein [Chitinophagaceae bacterium]|nr:PKD domain-containing protein [Bacteroidota bacterium]MCC6257366.1 PKD domain-containing protein [Chitinophagaceae bacterium]